MFHLEKVNLQVYGMSCGHCVKAIEGALGELNGVKNVKVELDSGTVYIEYQSTEISLNFIKDTIDNEGYEVKE